MFQPKSFYLPGNTFSAQILSGSGSAPLFPFLRILNSFYKTSVYWFSGREEELRLEVLWHPHCLCILFDPEHPFSVLSRTQSCLKGKFRCLYSLIKTDYIAPDSNKLLYLSFILLGIRLKLDQTMPELFHSDNSKGSISLRCFSYSLQVALPDLMEEGTFYLICKVIERLLL